MGGLTLHDSRFPRSAVSLHGNENNSLPGIPRVARVVNQERAPRRGLASLTLLRRMRKTELAAAWLVSPRRRRVEVGIHMKISEYLTRTHAMKD
jgi:hypothetical protein